MGFFAHSLVLLALSPLAHAGFTTQSSVTIPPRNGPTNKLLFVNNGSRVIEVGNRELSRVYALNDLSTYLLITGQSFDSPAAIVERQTTREIFYIGDIKEDDWGGKVRRYLRGYSLNDNSVQTTYSSTLYKGASYNIPSFTFSLSPDENRIYLGKVGTNTISVLNLDTYTSDATLTIPGIDTRKIQMTHELKYENSTVLAVDTKDTNGLSTLHFYNPLLEKNILTLKAESFGLASGANYATLRNTEFSKDDSQILMCGKTKCVVYNLSAKTVTASWAMDGSTVSSAKFSDDGRFVFVADGTYANPSFSVIASATGQIVVPAFKIRSGGGVLLKVFATVDAQTYVIMLKDRLLHLSGLDGSLLAEVVLPSSTESFESLAYLSEEPQSVRFLTSKSTGEISTWQLNL